MPSAEHHSVLAAYDLWASTYDQIDNPMIAEATVALSSHAALFKNASVLELGCGTGRNGVLALAAGARRFVGVDGSQQMLQRAAAQCADARTNWLCADLLGGMREADERDEPFDVAIICLVLEHFVDAGPIMESACRRLRRGGTLLVFELHPSLHRAGVGANFRVGDKEVRVESHRHDHAELLGLLGKESFDTRISDRHPSEEALSRSAKLGRYRNQPVLLELVARRI